jgi:hypothetical protein
MFTALERFLRFFNVRSLCMTATLPKDRSRILSGECGLRTFPAPEDSFEDLDARLAGSFGHDGACQTVDLIHSCAGLLPFVKRIVLSRHANAGPRDRLGVLLFRPEAGKSH